jgi:uncharacterized protein (DUF2147 family)
LRSSPDPQKLRESPSDELIAAYKAEHHILADSSFVHCQAAKGSGPGQSLKINESAIRMSTLRLAIYLVIFASCACSETSIRAAETTSPTGLWKNEDGTFEIFENGGKLSARIVALREPKTPEGKEKTDIHNPDRSKRDRPIIGLVFMSGFSRKSDTRWDNGTIYDPKSGSTYSCFMEFDGPDRIKVRGFIGISLIGRTDVWTRAQ